MRFSPRLTSRSAALGLALLAVALTVRPGLGRPPASVPLAKAVDQAHFVGIVRVTEVSPTPKDGFRASAPPVVTAKLLAVLKGDPKADLRVVWQTYAPSCTIREPETVEVVPPAVGGEYMVFLTKREDGAFARLGYHRHFHKMPAAPNVRVQPANDNWRGHIEVTPAIAEKGEAVRYRFSATRLSAEPWTGNNSNMTAEDVDVVDFTRKRVLEVKKHGVRRTAPAVYEKGDTYRHEIDLTEAFGITEPGEYWVFRGGAFEGNAPLRFEITDRLKKIP
jgi:hypothetical protein